MMKFYIVAYHEEDTAKHPERVMVKFFSDEDKLGAHIKELAEEKREYAVVLVEGGGDTTLKEIFPTVYEHFTIAY